MKLKLCIYSQPNYLTSRTAIGREQKQFIKIAFAVHLSAVISAERYRSDSGALKSVVPHFVFFMIIINKMQQSAKRKLLLNKNNLSEVFPLTVGSGKTMTFENRRGKYKELGKKVPLEYTPYGELWIEEVAAGLDKLPFRFTGKELDEETGLYYYGARYLDPKYSRWLSVDPALGEYIPSPGTEPSKLAGMGGVYNTINLQLYHYSNNNPITYIDPDGREISWRQEYGVSDNDFKKIQNYAKEIMKSNTEAGKRFLFLAKSKTISVVINVNKSGSTNCSATNWEDAQNGKGSDSVVNINVNDTGNYKENIKKDLRASLAHEVSGHSYSYAQGTSTYDGSGNSTKSSKEQWMGLFYEEQKAVAIENEYRSFLNLPQRTKYQNLWDMPVYNKDLNSWYALPGEFDAYGGYRTIPGSRSEKWRLK